MLTQSILPRAAVALVAGATLALSGLLLQRVLRNPLAEPSTLGVSAGAQLAMAAAAIYAPSLAQFSVSVVALAGGLCAAALVLALTWRRGLEPVSVVLAGMMIALTANAASAALILANGEYLFSLFIWGGGSLVQQGWAPTFSLAIRLALGLGAALLLLRPLTIAGLGDGTAKALGMAINASRLLIIVLAVWMATSVAAEVGVIGFIGLAAPALARLSGARTLKQQIISAPLLGAILLWLTDGLVQLLAGDGGERIPTGAATALLGGPLLIWLLPRLRLFEWPSVSAVSHPTRRAIRPYLLICLLALLVLAIALVGLFLGKGPDGWTIAAGDRLYALMDLRAPRLAIAGAAGGMLAAAGVVIQRITGNPLASPEILGVGAGAGAGLAAVLILAGVGVGLVWQLSGSAIGAITVLLVITAISARGSMGPERFLFAGIAINALCSSVLTAVIALGNQQSQILLQWLSGSTSSATYADAWVAIAGLALFASPLFLAARWLALLPLGFSVNKALGVPVARARFLLVVVSSLLTAVASMFVGPLSFIGLIAPHMARLLGLSRPWAHLAGSLLLGCGLMMLSDWLGRMVAFPYQLPVGLFASLIGGPYLIYLLARGVPRNV
ncbi:MAG: Fe(3+)-hydroxamate ABC transporter permease FhuB [Mesorhizobium sp.]